MFILYWVKYPVRIQSGWHFDHMLKVRGQIDDRVQVQSVGVSCYNKVNSSPILRTQVMECISNVVKLFLLCCGLCPSVIYRANCNIFHL